MNKFNSIIAMAIVAATFTACKKDSSEPVIVVPPSDGSTLTLNGLIGAEAGSSAGNSVYVDFSKDKQTSVARASWDLGFYSGDEFRVILNHTAGATAIALDKTDLNQVTAADTTALATSAALALGQGAGGFGLVDAVSGTKSAYLSGTVIKEVSATDAANKVYIINRGAAGFTENRGWQKVRVLRSGNGYTLQYAKINETTFKTLVVAKDANYNFKAVSFVNGPVNVEPAKADWDIEWSLSTYKASETIPYTFSDFVILNFIAGVQAGEVLTSKVSYADFKESDISSVTFKSERDVIAGNWRITSGGTLGVKTDRFYAVKDGAGNVYKLKFVSFISNDGGTRGKPVMEYKLVKKA
ncbi:HmuY family protein [Pedobacter punctiformis]|uniref:HmuY family protein n=1 Tax=Pedobacter punctiformis TaxID=3004097 RepID=A0ABT4L6S9_9SPHI|nr:HmuY family protein [Pedobacter sp. HCMS5-2]MCZ4243624.1 HmuY family protein [Pedobacter sp. HCMS5-2]